MDRIAACNDDGDDSDGGDDTADCADIDLSDGSAWADTDGWSCATYVGYGCPDYGYSYAVEGLNAQDACCDCGGGASDDSAGGDDSDGGDDSVGGDDSDGGDDTAECADTGLSDG